VRAGAGEGRGRREAGVGAVGGEEGREGSRKGRTP
jgi:hypothetical protein